MISEPARAHFMKAAWLPEMEKKSQLALLEVLQEGRAETNQKLMTAGQPNGSITFLLEGTVAITRPYPKHGEELVAKLQGPAIFGVTSFFSPNASIVTARCETPIWYLKLDRAPYKRLREAQPCVSEQLSLGLLLVIAEQFDVLDRKVSEFLASHPQTNRVSEWNEFRSKIFSDSAF